MVLRTIIVVLIIMGSAHYYIRLLPLIKGSALNFWGRALFFILGRSPNIKVVLFLILLRNISLTF